MPEAEDDTWGEFGFPVWLSGENGMHKCKETVGVIVGFDVDVEHDMFVLGLDLRVK